MKVFRNILFWMHLVSGVVAGIIILLMSVTGVLLTYERQMLASANRNAYSITAPQAGTERTSVQGLLERLRDTPSGEVPSAVTIRAGENSPLELNYGRERTLFFHPYTGAVLGEGAKGQRAFFHVVTDWHRWLGREGEGRDLGKAITGACNLAFLFLVVSGLYLWWPRVKSSAVWRNILWFRRGLNSKARDFNWHNVIGFWCLVPLFFIVLSGVVIGYPWASNLVFAAVGETAPKRRGPPGGEGRGGGETKPISAEGLDALITRAQSQVSDWRTLSFRVPTAASEPVEFTIDSGSGGQPQLRGTLTLNRAGAVEKWETFENQSRGRRLRAFFRFVHTGEYGGLAGQTLAGVASLGGVILVWTGFALAWRRLRAAMNHKSRRAAGQASGEANSSVT